MGFKQQAITNILNETIIFVLTLVAILDLKIKSLRTC
jgi:hypothetical protein